LEEEETEEESESVSRMIGLQFPVEWCTGKSGIVVPDGMIVVNNIPKLPRTWFGRDLAIKNSTVQVFQSVCLALWNPHKNSDKKKNKNSHNE
jgi:hypothetical protein